MEYKNESYISVIYTKNDFLDLRLHPNSNEKKWEKAINIFKDRIRGRYLNIMDELIHRNDLMRDGFVIMAMNCFLIETLLQFKKGWDETPRSRNKQQYTKFLLEEFSEIFTSQDLADKFYTDIRCGILHSAQTKGKSKLTIDVDYTVKLNIIDDNVYINVNVMNLTKAVEQYYHIYIEKLLYERTDILREKFLDKMNYICKK